MNSSHLFLATLGILAVALSYWGLINWLTEGSEAGLPALLLRVLVVYLTQHKLFITRKEDA